MDNFQGQNSWPDGVLEGQMKGGAVLGMTDRIFFCRVHCWILSRWQRGGSGTHERQSFPDEFSRARCEPLGSSMSLKMVMTLFHTSKKVKFDPGIFLKSFQPDRDRDLNMKIDQRFFRIVF
jgi:hypothetical protein